MELRHLRYFVAVAEEENVTRAAARLHVSQPPLSRQIHDLESELGCALFVRAGKTIRLTAAGRAFLPEARAILERVAAAARVPRAVAEAETGELRIGFAPSPTVQLLPAALAHFRRDHARARVQLFDQSTPEMLAGLRDRKIDLALLMQPADAALAGLSFEALGTFPVGVVVPAGHPWARRRSVPRAALAGEPIVTLAPRLYPDYQDLVRRAVGRSVRLRWAEECDTGPGLVAAVQAGRGIGITISAVAQAAAGRLKFVPLAPAPPEAVVGMAFRREATGPLVEAFVRAARAAAVAVRSGPDTKKGAVRPRPVRPA